MRRKHNESLLPWCEQLNAAAIIPAFNEAERIKPVLDAVAQSSLISDILVVSDGSTDHTYERALEVPGVHAIDLVNNMGKADAMWTGASRTEADVLLFLDADLIGLETRHVDAIVNPVLDGSADMCVGIFRGGRFLTDVAQKIAPIISGQRAIRRDMFLSIPDLAGKRMGVEIAVTQWARFNHIRMLSVMLDGVTHTMKEEKFGPVRGFSLRMHMYADIGKALISGHAAHKHSWDTTEITAKK